MLRSESGVHGMRRILNGAFKRRMDLRCAPSRITYAQWQAMVSMLTSVEGTFAFKGGAGQGSARGQHMGMRALLDCLIALALLLAVLMAMFAPAFGKYSNASQFLPSSGNKHSPPAALTKS